MIKIFLLLWSAFLFVGFLFVYTIGFMWEELTKERKNEEDSFSSVVDK